METAQLPDEGKGHGEKATRMREEAIQALLTERSVAAAARKIGVDRNTLHRWMQEPDFAGEYRVARSAATLRSSGRLAQACEQAVDNLVAVMDAAASDTARISASRAILSYAFRAVQLEDLDARLAELEEDRARHKPGERQW